MKLADVPAILQAGLAGLAFLLALLSYNLLAREQRSTRPRLEMLKAARTFFALCIALAVLVALFQLAERAFKRVDAEVLGECAKALDNLRVNSRQAQSLEQLRDAVNEQDASCRRLLGELETR